MDYNHFRNLVLDNIKGKNIQVIQNQDNKILNIKATCDDSGIEYKYDLHRFFRSIPEYDINNDLCNTKLNDLLEFDISSLANKTTLNNNQLSNIISKYDDIKQLFNRNNLNILTIARDQIINQNYDLAFAFNNHKISYNKNVIRLTFDNHVTELLYIFELARKSNVKSEQLEWYHNSNPERFETYDEYLKFSKKPNAHGLHHRIHYYGAWDINYSLAITPNSFKHKCLSNIINYYKGNIFFLKKSIFDLKCISPNFSQDLPDGVGHYLLSFLIRTKNNITVAGFSDIAGEHAGCIGHWVDLQRPLLINLLLCIKRITKL